MSEKIQKPQEHLTDAEKQTVLNTLSEFSRFAMQGKQPGMTESADTMIQQTLESTLAHTQNKRIGLFLSAGAAGHARAQARQPLHTEFFSRIDTQAVEPRLRDRIDNFSKSAAQARQYPDGDEAIAIQGSNIVQQCLSEMQQPGITDIDEDVLLSTVFYAVGQAGPGSPAEHMAQSSLPQLR